MRDKLVCIILFLGALALPLRGQVVDNKLGRDLRQIFPELSKGYIDLNQNGELDRLDDMDEKVAETIIKDSVLQAQEILDFVLENWPFISLGRLKAILDAMDNTRGAISEIVSLTYREDIKGIIEKKEEMGADTLFLTPSAKKEAMAKMNGLIATMVASYQKEGQKSETRFIKARNELFSMIEAGYPVPEYLAEDYEKILTGALINTVIKEAGSQLERVNSAIRTLGRLQADKAIPYLLQYMKDKRYTTECIRALGNIGNASALTLLTDMLEKDSSGAAGEIIKAIGKIGGTESQELLIGLISGKKVEHESAVLQALAAITEKYAKNQKILNIFKDRLNSEEKHLKILAIRGISNFDGRANGATLLTMLKTESDNEILMELIRGINKGKNPQAIGSFVGMLKQPELDDDVRIQIIRALGENPGGVKAMATLVPEIGNLNPRIREAAAQSVKDLYKIDNSSAAGVLAQQTRTGTDPLFLTEASRLMAEIADKSTLAALSTLLESPLAEVRKNAAWALYRIRPESNAKIQENLKKLVISETEPLEVRINAVRALGAIGTDNTTLKIRETLLTTAKMRGEKYSALRLFSIRALGKMGEPGESLVNTLSSIARRTNDPAIQTEVVKTLQRLSLLTSQAEGALYEVCRKTEDRELKTLIIETLGDGGSLYGQELAGELIEKTLPLSIRKRLVYALTRIGTPKAVNLILDLAKEKDVQEFITGLLQNSPGLVRETVNRRIKSESNEAVLAVLEQLLDSYGEEF